MAQRPHNQQPSSTDSAAQGLGAPAHHGKPHSREDSGPEPEGQVDDRFTKSGRHKRPDLEDTAEPAGQFPDQHQGGQGAGQGRGANPGQGPDKKNK